MRTTIEITDEQRARLLEIAARRGQKGFSKLVQEALDLFLRDQKNDDAVEAALRLRGRLAGDEADGLVLAGSYVDADSGSETPQSR